MRNILLILLLTTSGASLAMGKPLVVCLEENALPYSDPEGGIDNDVALAVADGLGLPLLIHWYETEEGDEGNPVLQVNALLSGGYCDIAGGFPLAKNSFADPGEQRYPLETGGGQRTFIALKPLAPSEPYHAIDYRLIHRPDQPLNVADLDDLVDLKVVAEENSIADLLLMAHRGGILRNSIHHVKPGDNTLFEALIKQQADAGWIARHRFESWRREVSMKALVDSGFDHDFSINLGFAALHSNQQLIERIDELIIELIDDEELETLFSRRGLTFRPPEPPTLMPPISQRLFQLY